MAVSFLLEFCGLQHMQSNGDPSIKKKNKVCFLIQSTIESAEIVQAIFALFIAKASMTCTFHTDLPYGVSHSVRHNTVVPCIFPAICAILMLP